MPIYFLYEKEEKDLQEEVHSLFERAVLIDMERRRDASGVLFRWGFNRHIGEADRTAILMNDTALVEKDIHSLPVSQQQAYNLQSHLFVHNPIDVFTLDSLFQNLLSEQQINSRTAVRYTRRADNRIFETSSDSSFYLKNYATPKIEPNLSNEFSLQGFVAIRPSVVFSNDKTFFLLVTVCYLLLAFVLIKGIDRSYSPITIAVEENKEIITIRADLFYHKKTRCLKQTGKEDLKLPPYPGILFQSLLEAGENGCSKKELIKLIWQEEEKEPTLNLNKFAQVLLSLRKSLKSYPVEIKTLHGKGYQLLVKKK